MDIPNLTRDDITSVIRLLSAHATDLTEQHGLTAMLHIALARERNRIQALVDKFTEALHDPAPVPCSETSARRHFAAMRQKVADKAHS